MNSNHSNTPIIVNQMIHTLYSDILTSNNAEKISHDNIFNIMLSLMFITENYKGISGIEKKIIVLSVINNLIQSELDNYEEYIELKLINDLILPVVIDTIIKFDKNKTRINKIKLKKKFINMIKPIFKAIMKLK